MGAGGFGSLPRGEHGVSVGGVQRDGVAQVLWFRLEEAPEHVLVPCEDLPQVPHGLAAVVLAVCGYAPGFQPQGFGQVEGTVEVILLGDDDELFHAEDVAGAIEAVIGTQARIVQDGILGGDALLLGETVHHGHFIVVAAAVVPGEEDFFGPPGLVELGAAGDAVVQHRAGGAVRAHRTAQD